MNAVQVNYDKIVRQRNQEKQLHHLRKNLNKLLKERSKTRDISKILDFDIQISEQKKKIENYKKKLVHHSHKPQKEDKQSLYDNINAKDINEDLEHFPSLDLIDLDMVGSDIVSFCNLNEPSTFGNINSSVDIWNRKIK